MTEVRFYHLQHQSQEKVIPVLLTKALERGHRIIVKMRDAAEVEKMNEHLWTFHPDSFIPHGSEKNGEAEAQPIWLTAGNDNPNKADVLILGQGVESEQQGDFELCCEMLDGHDQEAVNAARTRWKVYKGKDFDVTYWQQNESGGWGKK